jgi:hypothetical protein
LVTNLNPKPQAIDNLTFANPCSAMLYVPAGSIEAYKSAEVWGDFKTITAYTP